jgi:predicted SAM-dependent methyltransferase
MLENKFKLIKDALRPIYHRLKLEPFYSIYKINDILINIAYGKLEQIETSLIEENINKYIVNNYMMRPTKYRHLNYRIDNLLISELTKIQIEKLDHITTLYETTHDFNRIIHDNLAETIRKYCKSPYTIVNTRMWTTKPESESFGPNAFHTDGFYPSHFKVMIYPFGMNEDRGYLMVGDKKIINMPEGTVILFKNSDVLHAGVAGKTKDRLVIEITVLRTFFHLPQEHEGHPNGRHYKNFILVLRNYVGKNGIFNIILKLLNRKIRFCIENIKLKITKKINLVIPIRKVNLGSGKKCWIGWRCFDALEYETIETLKFTPNCALPENLSKVDLFYSSHNLEHLNDETVENILKQVSDKIKDNGHFLLKMPDFELLLNLYRSGLLVEINDSGVLDTMFTWCNKGVMPTIENKVSMVFCGYMNSAYGNHFENQRKLLSNYYHGPALIQKEKLEFILKNESIRNISKILNSHATLDKDFSQFNHQNAWARDDINLMLFKNGFKLISDNKDVITKNFKYKIPDIKTSIDSSMYLLYQKIN